MKSLYFLALAIGLTFMACGNKEKAGDTAATDVSAANSNATTSYYIDVHQLEPGKVTFADVEAAHKKDLETQGKHGVEFLKFWVDESKGQVYCLSKAPNMEAVTTTHKEAHGLIPGEVYKVSEGKEAAAMGNKPLFIDVHYMGAGKVKAEDVVGAHEKDLAIQGKHGVSFLNYWVDEEKGVIMCLAEAPDSNAVKATHKEAHGLTPAYVLQVKEGK